MRFGYAVAQPDVIDEMMKVKDSYNVDVISVLAATAALLDQESAKKSWDYVRGERARLTSELQQLGWSVLPSQANFILATVPGSRARDAYLKLKQQGILVRYFDKPGLTDKLRITIGRAEENNALLAGIKSLPLGEKAA
jgi:histidinol-phosphate aminotransferase